MQALGFLNGVEVGTLEIFHQCRRHGVPVLQRADMNGHVMQARNLRGTPAAFARNDLVYPLTPRMRPHKDGLQDATHANGTGQFIQCAGLHLLAWLEGTRLHYINRQAGNGFGRFACFHRRCGRQHVDLFTQQGSQSATETGATGILLGFHQRAFPFCTACSPRRSVTSVARA